MFATFYEQPPAFRMMFMIEFWERFGYYTVQGILTLFFIRHLGYSDEQAYYTFGAFSALVYAMVVVGGFLGDRILGTKRTIVLGLIVLVLGYFFLAVAHDAQVFLALALVCVGNGLFKANPSNLLSKCYEPRDPRLHAGFTLYYMAINLGSIFALLLGPVISSHFGYPYAYGLSSAGLLIGLASYWLQRHCVDHIQTSADKRPVGILEWFLIGLVLVGLTYLCAYLLHHVVFAKHLMWTSISIALLFYGYLAYQEKGLVAKKMLVALILMIEAVVFFTLYQQMPTSLNLFAVNNVIPTILGLPINPQSFQVLNPIWIVLASPVLAHVYMQLNKKNIPLTVGHKFAVGMTLCGISFLSLYFARYFHTPSGQVSSWWLVFSYLFQSLGELLVSALGVAMVAELVPSSMAGFVMGMWFFTSTVAGFVGASVASYTAMPVDAKPGIESLMLYTQVFGCIGLVTLGISVLMWLLAKPLHKYIVAT